MSRLPVLLVLLTILAALPAHSDDYILRAGPYGAEVLARALPPEAKVVELAGARGLLRVDLPPGAYSSLYGLQRAGLVVWAEPNHPVEAMDVEADARVWIDPIGGNSLSDSQVQDQDAFVQAAIEDLQELTDGKSIVVAVVDSGVDYGHSDNVFTNRLLDGYDFVDGDSNAQDDQGHGTRVAGVIVAVLGKVDILPVKVLDSTAAGTVYDVAEGIEWAADEGADVINLSLGGPYDSQTLRDAISYAETKGAIVVASAGNRDTSLPHYPAAISSVIAVAGLDGSDVRADFALSDDDWASSYGTHIDVSAPAIDVITTSYPDDFVEADGTSYSAAIVSAILAGQKELGKTNSEAESDLEATAVDIDARNPGYEGLLGAGRVDAGEAAL